MGGRRPKPTKLRIVQGNPGKRALPKDEPEPEVCIPDPPGHLSKVALEEWERIAPILEKQGLISDMYRAALAAYCDSYSDWVKAGEMVERKGLTYTTDKGNVIQHPAVGMKNTAKGMMHRFLTEFGLSPSSITRVSRASAKKGSKDPWDDM